MVWAAPFETRVSPAVRTYAENSAALGDSRKRIASGNRILRNGDDASSLSAATKLQTQTSTLRSTLTSGARATSFLQVAAAGLSQVRAILETLDDLTAKANAPGRTPFSYATLNAQFQSSLAEINKVVTSTTFNGESILDGSASGSGAPYIQVGATSNDRVTLAVPDVSAATLFGGTVSLHNAAASTAAAPQVSTAQHFVDHAIALVNAYQQRLDLADEAARRSIGGIKLGIDALLDTNREQETRSADQMRLTQQTAAALLAQAMRVNSNLLGLVSS